MKKPTIDDYYILLAFGDLHQNNHDPRIQNIILQILTDLGDKVRYVLDGGDGIEGNSLNSFAKSHDELVGLQTELDADYAWRKRINEVSPDSVKILLECNHFSARLARAKKNQYFLSDLKAMEQENLFRLKELDWQLRQDFIWGKNELMFVHGDGAGVGSQKNIINASRDLVKENNISIIRFHSHTTGYEVHRKLGKHFHAIQIGTGTDLRKGASYIKHSTLLPNWTNSIGIFYLHRSGTSFFYVPVVIEDGAAIFANQLYVG